MYRLLLLFLLTISSFLYAQQNLSIDPLTTGQFSTLSDREKIDHIKYCLENGINLRLLFVQEFADAGGRDIIPYLMEEILKYDFYRLNNIEDNRLDFITNALIYFRNKNLLTPYERYYIAEIFEAKIANYVKRYGQVEDMLVTGINANIWTFLNPDREELPRDELEKILLIKYRLMGLIE
jgi:hypothetical protein